MRLSTQACRLESFTSILSLSLSPKPRCFKFTLCDAMAKQNTNGWCTMKQPVKSFLPKNTPYLCRLSPAVLTQTLLWILRKFVEIKGQMEQGIKKIKSKRGKASRFSIWLVLKRLAFQQLQQTCQWNIKHYLYKMNYTSWKLTFCMLWSSEQLFALFYCVGLLEIIWLENEWAQWRNKSCSNLRHRLVFGRCSTTSSSKVL